MVESMKPSDKVSKMGVGDSNGSFLPAIGFMALFSGGTSLISLALGWPVLVSLLCVTSTVAFGVAAAYLSTSKGNSYMKSSDEYSMLETPNLEVSREHAARILREQESKSPSKGSGR